MCKARSLAEQFRGPLWTWVRGGNAADKRQAVRHDVFTVTAPEPFDADLMTPFRLETAAEQQSATT